jgi:hypothetical protein
MVNHFFLEELVPACDFANTVFRGAQRERPFGYMNLNVRSTCLSEVSSNLLLHCLLSHATQSVFCLQLLFSSDFIHDVLHRFFSPPRIWVIYSDVHIFVLIAINLWCLLLPGTISAVSMLFLLLCFAVIFRAQGYVTVWNCSNSLWRETCTTKTLDTVSCFKFGTCWPLT